MTYIENVFVCMAPPLVVALLSLKRGQRAALVFCLAGMGACLLSAYLNTFFAQLYQADAVNAATQIAPVVEEIMKLLPLLFFLAVFEPTFARFRLAAVIVAASFATFENICFLTQNGADQILFLLIRGFGTGAMHVVCGNVYGGVLRPVWDSRPLRAACLFALLCVAIIYHAIYNLLVSAGGTPQLIAYFVPLPTALCFRLGTVLRSTAGILGLFLGTAIVGVGTAIGNVLLPAVVKAEYPTRVGQVTAYFTVAMVAAAAIGLALNVPLSTAGLGWNGALMIWGIAVVITGFIWRKNVSLRLGTTDPAETASDQKPIWKSGLAWCVTLYFGINSLIFYAVIGWLPTILQSSGMAGQTAGMVTSLYQVVSLAPSLLVPTLAGKRRDQRGWLLLGSILNIIGITTLMASSAAAAQVAATIILGLANGCAFSMGLAQP